MIAAYSEGVLHEIGKNYFSATFVCSRPQECVIRA